MSKMKAGKAACPSGIVIEMIKAAGDQSIDYLTTLFNQIMYGEVAPTEWHLSYIINLFKGKEDVLLRRNCKSLKLEEQVMKVLEHVLNIIIRKQVSFDEMQLGFINRRGATAVIFIIRQLQEKYMLKKKIHITFL